MSYVSQAVAAKNLARDILRTQMAIRIQERLAKAKDEFTAAVKSYANYIASFVTEDADDAKAAADRTATREAFAAALVATPGLTSDELTAIQTQVSEAQSKRDKEDKESSAASAKEREAATKRHLDGIDLARAEVARVTANVAKLESGEMKVDAEELKALANKLIADGKVEAGESDDSTEVDA